MTIIQCDISECIYNDNKECTANMIQMDIDGCLTFEFEEEEEENTEPF